MSSNREIAQRGKDADESLRLAADQSRAEAERHAARLTSYASLVRRDAEVGGVSPELFEVAGELGVHESTVYNDLEVWRSLRREESKLVAPAGSPARSVDEIDTAIKAEIHRINDQLVALMEPLAQLHAERFVVMNTTKANTKVVDAIAGLKMAMSPHFRGEVEYQPNAPARPKLQMYEGVQ